MPIIVPSRTPTPDRTFPSKSYRATNPDGTLTYSFVESVKASYPFWTIRFIGGALFLTGMFIMFYNMVKTIAGQKAYDAPVLSPAAAHA